MHALVGKDVCGNSYRKMNMMFFFSFSFLGGDYLFIFYPVKVFWKKVCTFSV
jgi:hypothetical protein